MGKKKKTSLATQLAKKQKPYGNVFYSNPRKEPEFAVRMVGGSIVSIDLVDKKV